MSHYPGFAADLGLVVERTGHRRYLETTDPARPGFRARHVEAVRRTAAQIRAGEWPPGLAAPPELPADDPGRPENRKAFMGVQRAAEAAGCGRKIPAERRKGCGCSFECLRGWSPAEDGGVTLWECWRCPDRPPLR